MLLVFIIVYLHWFKSIFFPSLVTNNVGSLFKEGTLFLLDQGKMKMNYTRVSKVMLIVFGKPHYISPVFPL